MNEENFSDIFESVENYIINRDGVYLTNGVRGYSTNNNSLYYPISEYSKTSLKEFAKLFSKEENEKPKPAILPDGVKYIEYINNSVIVVIEQKPAIRSIKVNIDLRTTLERLKNQGKYELYNLSRYDNFKSSASTPYIFNLAFPYIESVFLIKKRENNVFTHSFYCYYKPTVLKSLEDELFPTNLPNINSRDQSVCITDQSSRDIYAESYFKKITQLLQDFWGNSFNTDYIDNYQQYENDEYFRDFFTWQYFSKIDPYFFLNVKWKKPVKKLSYIIDNLKKYLKEDNDISFFRIYDDNEAYIKDGIEYNKTPLESVWISESHIIKINDKIDFNQEEFTVKSFYKNYSNDNIYALIKNSNSEEMVYIYDLVKFQKKDVIESCVINGKKINVGDVLLINTEIKKIYKSVTSITRCDDTNYLVTVGSSYNNNFLLNNIDFDVIDKNSIVINGVSLDTNKEYIILSKIDFTSVWMRRLKIVSIDFELNKLSVMDMKNGQVSIMSMDVFTENIVNQEYNMYNYNLYRILDYICTSDKEGEQLIKDVGVIKTGSRLDLDYDREFAEQFYNSMVDNQNIFLPSFDSSIDLKTNDHIAIESWRDVEDMGKPKVITEIGKEDNFLFFNYKNIDGTGEIRRFNYIDTIRGKILNMSKVRKISLNMGNFSSGDKVKAKIAGIYGFPKKNINEIAYFIIDHVDKPLIVFKSLHTFWYNDTFDSSFEKTSLNPNVKYVTTNFSLQNGDIINSPVHTYSFLIFSRNRFLSYDVTYEQLNYFNGTIEPIEPLGFLNPRLPKALYNYVSASTIPNLFNGYRKTNVGNIISKKVSTNYNPYIEIPKGYENV